MDGCEPKSIVGMDLSSDFVAYSAERTQDKRAKFEVAGAEALSLADSSVSVAVSVLVLNFVTDKAKALAEMQRVVHPGGLISFYVWDYPGGGMGFIDEFWKSAVALDSSAEALDEGKRFPFCTMDGLAALCKSAGIAEAEIAPIEVQTIFPTFEDFWQPFTLGAGPAPGYAMSLDESVRADLKSNLMARLDTGSAITLPARAWAVKAVRN
ncbi:MAG: class I SAM-dependent methyltransferase [Fimbriimonadaceae bacterium]|nr:class I SAM-dependent methyltransferase [Alphaproteobacteria bacterium]